MPFLNEEGKQYHINCKEGDVGRYVLLPGDPFRTDVIASMFDDEMCIRDRDSGDQRQGASSVSVFGPVRKESRMNYGNIKECDIANGPGVRVSLFVSGCRHHCKGCFNAETWDFGYGKPFTEETGREILRLLEPSYRCV